MGERKTLTLCTGNWCHHYCCNHLGPQLQLPANNICQFSSMTRKGSTGTKLMSCSAVSHLWQQGMLRIHGFDGIHHIPIVLADFQNEEQKIQSTSTIRGVWKTPNRSKRSLGEQTMTRREMGVETWLGSKDHPSGPLILTKNFPCKTRVESIRFICECNNEAL